MFRLSDGFPASPAFLWLWQLCLTVCAVDCTIARLSADGDRCSGTSVAVLTLLALQRMHPSPAC